MAKRERYGEMVGTGCFVQGLGLLMPVGGFFVLGGVGAVVGGLACVLLLLVGSRMALKWRCGACKNPIASGEVRVCPACHEELDGRGGGGGGGGLGLMSGLASKIEARRK